MKHWEFVREQLAQALKKFPEDQKMGILEFLKHNEFELAWEEMEEVADRLGIMDSDFWRPMAKAAASMVSASYEN